ncbi:hypothetical protein EB796_015357 [Bugula neritina]|uniref:Uncharacterized protein n=1 Tax=Bugula neritina TaxID=10212 RepID=A0A7J7JJ34_BUGNE|nr:hypothetical protein EB796_015357 [Bugula neritina]
MLLNLIQDFSTATDIHGIQLKHGYLVESSLNVTAQDTSIAECVYSARLHSHDSTSELYYSCIKGKYQTKLFSQLTNAAEVI